MKSPFLLKPGHGLAIASVLVLASTATFAQNASPSSPKREEQRRSKPQVDQEGFPLPKGAVARIGSARFRHESTVARLLKYSPDGRMIACVDIGGVQVFDAAEGRMLHQVKMPRDRSVHAIRFSSNGRQLAIATGGSEDCELLTYDLTNSSVIHRTRIPGKAQIVFEVDAECQQALIQRDYKTVFLWERAIREKKWEVDLPMFQPLSLTGINRFLVMHGDVAHEHDIETGKRIRTTPVPETENEKAIEYVTVSGGPNGLIGFHIPHDRKIAVRNRRGEIARYDVPISDFSAPLRFSYTDRRSLLFSRDGRYLICIGDSFGPNANTYVWDLHKPDQRAPIATLFGGGCACFSPDGKVLALDANGVIVQFRTADWKPLREPKDSAFTFREVFFSPDGTTIFGRSEFGWCSWPAAGGAGRPLISEKHCYFCWSLSANGDVVAGIPTTGRSLLLNHLKTGREVRIPLDDFDLTSFISLSADGREVIAYREEADNRQFVAFDTATGRVRWRQLSPPETAFRHVVMDPTNAGLSHCVFAKRRGFLVIDFTTGRRSIIPSNNSVSNAILSGDGNCLAIESETRDELHTVELWDAVRGRPLGELGMPTRCWKKRAFSCDGRSVITGDYDGAIRVFEVATCQQRASFQHAREIRSLAIDQRGTRVVAASEDAPAYVWDLLGDPGTWTPDSADAIWNNLGSPDAAIAYSAIQKLRCNPGDAVAFFKGRLNVPTAPSPVAVATLLKGLESPRFHDREAAQKKLSDIAELIQPSLMNARKTASEEAATRLGKIWNSTETLTSDRSRQIRACEVLEGISSDEAKRLLVSWASGPDMARLTIEAKQSLARLGR